MSLTSIHHFLELFRNAHDTMTLKQFTTTARVRKASGVIVRMRDHLSPNDIALVYESLYKKKNDYLSNFYHKSLDFTRHSLIREPPMTDHFNNATHSQYKNLIRNLYYREILEQTETGIPNLRPYLQVILEMYRDHVYDYKIVTNASLNMIRSGTSIGSILSGYFFRASIMNPYLVYSLNHSILHAKRVFTPTLGWSSYLVGFIQSGIEEYVGVDVIPRVCQTTLSLANQLSFNNARVYCQPSEDLLNDPRFMRTYKGHFDTVFFSPPYYRLELYKGGTQSTDRYATYEEWLRGYWKNTMELCHHVTTKNATVCYIVANYDTHAQMVDDMNRITRQYFTFSNQYVLKSGKQFTHSKHHEVIHVFKKKSSASSPKKNK